jgi:hypothetical protein
MVPALGRALGDEGHRPTVGTNESKHSVYVFAAVNVVTAARHHNREDSPKDAIRTTGQRGTPRLQEAFAAHLRHVGRVYPRADHEGVVPLIDNGPLARRGGGRRRPGVRPAPGTEAVARLKPSAGHHRSILEAAPSAGDARGGGRTAGEGAQ